VTAQNARLCSAQPNARRTLSFPRCHRLDRARRRDELRAVAPPRDPGRSGINAPPCACWPRVRGSFKCPIMAIFWMLPVYDARTDQMSELRVAIRRQAGLLPHRGAEVDQIHPFRRFGRLRHRHVGSRAMSRRSPNTRRSQRRGGICRRNPKRRATLRWQFNGPGPKCLLMTRVCCIEVCQH